MYIAAKISETLYLLNSLSLSSDRAQISEDLYATKAAHCWHKGTNKYQIYSPRYRNLYALPYSAKTSSTDECHAPHREQPLGTPISQQQGS